MFRIFVSGTYGVLDALWYYENSINNQDVNPSSTVNVGVNYAVEYDFIISSDSSIKGYVGIGQNSNNFVGIGQITSTVFGVQLTNSGTSTRKQYYPSISQNETHHIKYTYVDGVHTLYLDGTTLGTFTDTNVNITKVYIVSVGANNTLSQVKVYPI